MTRSRHEQPLLESILTERSAPAVAMLLQCRKCHAPFLDDTPQPHHPTVDIQALRSNLLPSREITSQTNALIEAEMSDLNRLEETIRSVQDTLRELENRRDTLRREIQRRKSWGAPIRRFPVEVLQEIFTHVCLGDGQNQFSLDINSHVEDSSYQCPDCWYCGQCEADPILRKVIIATTVALSQICFHWRSIIIASPSLWASLRLDISQMKTRHANLVKLYLRHSVQHPLKIHLRNISSDRDFESEDGIKDVDIGQVGSRVVCSVMKELYRCREFYYEPDQDNLIGLVPEQCRPKGLPLLSSFSDRVHLEPSHVDRWFWDLVKVAPNLVDVSVEKFRADSFPKNLRDLTIKRQNYTAFLEMPSPCPKLRSLNLHDFLPVPSYGSTLPPPPRTRHPMHTRKFTITTSKDLSNLDLLFSSVTLSSLSSLEIFTDQDFSGDGGHTTNSYERIYRSEASNLGALRALIQCSGCSLEDLTLHIDSYSSGDITSLLELQPSLARLDLEVWVPREKVGESEPSVLVDLFARMSEPQSPLLPCVRHLEIHEVTKDTGYDINKKYKIAASALDLTESRERRGEPIPNISLSFDCSISGGHSKRHCLPNDLEQRGKELAARGVKCRIALPKVLTHCG